LKEQYFSGAGGVSADSPQEFRKIIKRVIMKMFRFFI
jgi:hypothetical protein